MLEANIVQVETGCSLPTHVLQESKNQTNTCHAYTKYILRWMEFIWYEIKWGDREPEFAP